MSKISFAELVKKLFPYAAIIWMLSIVFLYFVDVKKMDSPQSSTSNVSAVVVGDYRLEGRKSHLYYYEALKSVIVHKQTADGFTTTSVSPAASLMLVFICLFSLGLIFLRKRGLDTVKLKFLPIAWLLPFLGITLLVYSFWLSNFDVKLEPILFTNIYGKLFVIIFYLLVVVMFTLSLGKKIKEFFTKDDLGAIADFLLSFAFGAAVLSIVYFCLALFGAFTQMPILILFVAILVLCIKEFIYWLKLIFVIPNEFSVRLLSPTLFLLFVFFCFLAQNSLEAMRPIPIGHDDLIQYAKNIKLLSESGRHIGGVIPYPWELFVSSVNILSHSWMVTSFFNASKSVLAFVSLYFIADYFCKARKIQLFSDGKFVPILVATIFYTLPMVVFQSAVDLKVDLAAFFYVIMATYLLFQWKNANKNRYLFLAFFLFGFAFMIKVTTIFYVSGAAVYLLYIFFQNKTNIWQILKIVGFCLVFFLLSFAPYALKSVSTFGMKKAAQNYFLYSKSEVPQIHLLTKKDSSETGEIPEYNKLSGENGAQDLNKFIAGGSSLSNILRLPFVVTMNSNVTGEFVDITFIFLAIMPLSVILLLNKRKQNKDKSGLLFLVSVVGLIAFFLWLAFGSGIVWYGMAVFLPLLLLLADSLKAMSKYNKPVFSVVLALIFSWLALSLFYRLTYNPKYLSHIMPKDASYLRGSCDDQCYINYIFPENKTIKLINEDNKTESKSNILMTGKLLDFLIYDSNRNTLFDNYETFSEIHQEKDDALTIERLKKANFKYIIISRFSYPIYLHADVINQAKQEMYDFVSKNPDSIKIINNPSQDGSIIAEIL
ncbi:MAG: hypothetical protein WCI57_03595 [Candidatus Berkelbacteria bacterium]